MPASNYSCPPTCPGCRECDDNIPNCSAEVPGCKVLSPGSICQCELLYLAAVNGELLASSDRIRALYNNLADYYLRSSERGCGRSN